MFERLQKSQLPSLLAFKRSGSILRKAASQVSSAPDVINILRSASSPD
jgi:hypothetical protein